MQRITSVLIAALLTLVLYSNVIAGFEYRSIEVNKLQKRIQCNRQSYNPPGNGLGSLWGCYNMDETVRLWINGFEDNPSKIDNIKLSVVIYHGQKIDISGKLWAKIISETYAGKMAEAVSSAFLKGKPVKYESGDFIFNIIFHNGPKADEHIMVLTEKTSN